MLPLSENELDKLVKQERERGAPPLTDWDSLATRLKAEGLIRTRTIAGLTARTWMQAAAAVLLVAGGAALGRITAAPPQVAITPSVTQPTPVANAAATPAAEFKSTDEAWATLNRAGEDYQRASAYLSASNAEIPLPNTTDTYRTRLAALDKVMGEMRNAMHEAPHDPVINQYYLATVGAREATLRQLGTALPKGVKLSSF